MILGLEGFHQLLTRLEETTEQTIDTESLGSELVNSVRSEDKALTELDYLCLGLLEENRFGGAGYLHYEPLVECIQYLGQLLHSHLRMHRVYVNGQLPYHFCKIRSNGLYLQRSDLFKKEVARELAEEQLALQRDLQRPQSAGEYPSAFAPSLIVPGPGASQVYRLAL